MGAQTDFPNRGALPCFISQMGCENIKFVARPVRVRAVFLAWLHGHSKDHGFCEGFALIYEC